MLKGRVTSWCVPLGLKGLLVDTCEVPADKVVEMDWWDDASFCNGSVAVVCTPAQHFSNRGTVSYDAMPSWTDLCECVWVCVCRRV